MGEARRQRWLCAAIAAAALAVGASACSSGTSTTESIPSTPSTVIAATTTPIATTASPADAAPETTAVASTTVTAPVEAASTTVLTAPAVDGATQLQGAVAAMAAGYHFTTTLTIDGAVVLTADGDRVGDGTRLAVTQGGASVQYVITSAGTWVLPDGGEWQELDGDAASTDPIAALATPTSVAISSASGTATTLAATVPAASLGLAGDSPVTMSATIDHGAITTVGYNTTIDGKAAVMQAAISAVVDSTPVVAPI